ncbi:MAG: hypothetical protein IPN34_09835 [Planctomycetes bacterium]|nr:hypothetical protein [Planctomycetota bacterium]
MSERPLPPNARWSGRRMSPEELRLRNARYERRRRKRRLVSLGGLALGALLAFEFARWCASSAEAERGALREVPAIAARAQAGEPLGPDERTAQSAFCRYWGALQREQKLQLLEAAKQARSEDLLGFLLEINWFWSPREADFDVARGMLDALYACSDRHVDVALFVCQQVAFATSNSRVRAHAQRYVAALVERRLRLGR